MATDDRMFGVAMFGSAWIFLVGAVMVDLVASPAPLLLRAAVAVVHLTISAGFAGAFLVMLYAKNNAPLDYRPGELGSRTRRALDILGLHSLDCGCVYGTGMGSYSSQKPEALPQETEDVWVRSVEGARVRFRLYEQKLARCTYCGRHRFTYEPADPRRDEPTKKEFWVDDVEPFPGDDRDVVEEGRVEASETHSRPVSLAI